MQTKKYALFTLIIIAILGGALYVILHSKKTDLQSPLDAVQQGDGSSAATSTRAYANATYGYSLAYPVELQQKVYGQNDVVFGHITGTGADENVDGVAEARVIIVQSVAGQTFGQAAAKELENLCAADGPTSSFSCTAIQDIKPFPSGSGVLGLEFYLKGELKVLATKKVTVVDKGPYFAFALQTGATGSSVLVIHPPLNQSAAEAASTTIESIAKSVKLDAGQDGDVLLQAYISEHLAQLSSVKPSLGGTFYLTKIEAADGKGVAYYEDGHNAYIADFTYSIDASGTMTVITFKVRK